MNKKTTVKQLLYLLLIIGCSGGCSDKYESFLRVNAPPIIYTNHDSINIRVKDYSGYFANNGLLRITVQDTLAKGLYLTADDSSGQLEVFYDSLVLKDKLPINKPVWIYVACKKVGLYNLKLKLTDQLEQRAIKEIPVKVLPNEAPIADFRIDVIEVANSYAVIDIVSTSKSLMSRIVEYTYYVNGLPTNSYLAKMRMTIFSGTNRIGLKVKDDLGDSSLLVEKIKIVL